MLRSLSLVLVLVPAVAFSAPLPPEETAPEQPAPPAPAPMPPTYDNPAYGYGQYAPPPPGYGQYAPPPGYGQYAPPPGYGQYAPPPSGYGYGGYGCAQPCYPQPACAQSACAPAPSCCNNCCATDHLKTDAWRTVIGDDGAWYRVRDVKKGNGGLIAAGLILWLGGWMGTGWGGTMHDGSIGAIAFLPFIGPFVSASIQSSEHHDGSSAGYVIGGLTQITGFVLFIAGAASKHVVHERQRISFGAVPTQTGFASNLSVRF